jgi:predicted anti-sigma-YlaC factor YlaD
MKIERDVILDLLPVYLSGEASAATRELVEEHLKQDPDLARRVRDHGAELVPKLSLPVPPELELRSLLRTRRLLGVQKWLFGLTITFTSIAFATRIHFQDGRIDLIRPLILDYPLQFGIPLTLGVGCWIAYRRIRRRLRSTAG